MPPVLALILTLGFCLSMFLWERRREKDSSPALWLPFFWFTIAGSRFVSQWLSLGSPDAFANVNEGSPIDAVFFGLMILLGVIVLAGRRFSLVTLLRQNAWLAVLLVYSLVSVLWSEYPEIAIKRWIKAIGNPIMALVVLTDPSPPRAFLVVMRRCAYVLLPFSVLFIKYFPEFGRGFDGWTGEAFNNGVALNKNGLGVFCMLIAMVLVWSLFCASDREQRPYRRGAVTVDIVLLAMAGWLLQMSDSATSLVTLVLGILVMLLTKWAPFIRDRFMTAAIVVSVAVFALEAMFDPYAWTLQLLGRDPSLTDRTAVWADALALQPSVLVGAGFESFWLGDRLSILWSKWWWRPNQAHNGYIEAYLNAGLVGVVLLAGWLLRSLRVISRSVSKDTDWGRIRAALFVAILAYNWTEAAFKGVHIVWMILFVVCIDHRRWNRTAAKLMSRRRIGRYSGVRYPWRVPPVVADTKCAVHIAGA